MVRLGILAFAVALGLGSVPGAEAAPGHVAVGAPASGIEQVAQGCGPGGVRDFRGYCRPAYRPRPVYRACPYGFRLTPYGCRRFY